MDRQARKELKALSKEILGSSSRWQKLTKGVMVDSGKKSANGKAIKTSLYMTPEEILEHLRRIKSEQEQANNAEKVQSEAGGSAR